MALHLSRRQVCVGVAAAPLFVTAKPLLGAAPTSGGRAFERLEPGRWTAIHTMDMATSMAFPYQSHAGGVYDSRRNRLVIFGSDTHGTDWTNAPYFFDLDTLTWQRPYFSDPASSYTVDVEGVPVAGPGGKRPWAMHTYGAVAYDPGADALILASHPAHLAPGRFTDALDGVWQDIRQHPTWIYRMSEGLWEPFVLDSISFFARAVVFDTHREVMIGVGRGMNTFSLGDGRWWRPVIDQPPLQWGLNGVYDKHRRAVVAFGNHTWSNDVAVYKTGGDAYRIMPTPGRRPPPARYAPMAYHERLGKVVALAQRFPEDSSRTRVPDHRRRAETWLYDPAADSWEPVPEAELPFGWYMNYKMFYIPPADALILVAEPPGERTTVFALRL